MNSETYHLIQEWIAARPALSPYIFTSFAGRGGAQRATARPMHPSAIRRMIQEYAVACGLEHIKPHDLRRFFGTTIVAKTGDIRKAQKSLRECTKSGWATRQRASTERPITLRCAKWSVLKNMKS
jgi:integrase